MLDPGMQQFADEMQAKPRLSRRSSTRRGREIDNSSAPGAAELGRRIQAFWAAAGFDNIRIEMRRRPARIPGFRNSQRFDRRPAQTGHD